MTFQTISHAELERIAAEHGIQPDPGKHCDHIIIPGAYFCARREAVAA